MTQPHPSLHRALDRLQVPDDLRTLITTRHGEPHRHYHTLRHIDLMLGELPADHAFLPEMTAATLFHDIVYDPMRSDNEAQSLAVFFETAADRLAAGGVRDTDLVAAMILATKSHHFRREETAQDAAINLLLKADLSILWHPDPAIYDWYARGVRQEYAFVPDAQFREARGKILSGLRDDLLQSGQLDAGQAAALQRNTARELDQGD